MTKWSSIDIGANDFNEKMKSVIVKSPEYKQKEIVYVENDVYKIFDKITHENIVLNEGIVDSVKGTVKNNLNPNTRNENKVNKKTLIKLGVSERLISENILGSEKVYTISGDWDISGRDELDLSVLAGVKITIKGKFDCSNTSISSFENFPIITCTDFIFKNGTSEIANLKGCPIARRNIELDGTKLKSIVGLQLTNLVTNPESISGNLILADTGLNNLSIKTNENASTMPSWTLKVGGILDISNCFPIININWFVDAQSKGIVSRQVKYNIDDIISSKLSQQDLAKFDKLVGTKVDAPIDRIDFIAHLKVIRQYHKLAVQSPVVNEKQPTSAPVQSETPKETVSSEPTAKDEVKPEINDTPNENLSIDLNKLGRNKANLQQILLGIKNSISNKDLRNKLEKLKSYSAVIDNPDLNTEIEKVETLIRNAHLEKLNKILDNLLEKAKYEAPIKTTKPKTEKFSIAGAM